MNLSTKNLVLTSDTAIDLQTHTIYSDGTWTPEELLRYMRSERFGLVAITDHDRVDTAALLQEVALREQFPVLMAVEMSTSWRGGPTDVLCYGFDPEKHELSDLAHDVARRQRENTMAVYERLSLRSSRRIENAGVSEEGPRQSQELGAILEKPGSQQPHELATFLVKHGYAAGAMSAWDRMKDAGFSWATNDIADVVEAAHRCGAVCLIAHPGRGEGFTCYDALLLDQLRQEVPIDGFEVYYPAHTPEQIAMYLAYARQHHLLISSGSDSHGPARRPIKYRAELSRDLLERLGIQVQ